MVKLSQVSNAREWDQIFRKNFSLYEDEINKITYSLQRKQRSTFSLSYPKFYQKDIQRLQALKTMQQLGAVKQEEVEAYKAIDPSVSKHYNKTFDSTYLLKPSLFQLLGVGLLIGSAIVARPLWSVSSFMIIAPLAFKFTSYNNIQKTGEFLDFTLKVRIAKCLLEKLAIDNGETLPEKDKKSKK